MDFTTLILQLLVCIDEKRRNKNVDTEAICSDVTKSITIIPIILYVDI